MVVKSFVFVFQNTNYNYAKIKLFLFHCQVSVLDVDICGPSIPRIMGLEGEQV